MNRIITGCFLIAFAPNIFSETINGELNVLIFDNFEAKKSETVYQLNDNGEYYTLDLPDSVKKQKLISGQSISVEGDVDNSAQDTGVTSQSGLSKSALHSPGLGTIKNDKKIKVKSFKFIDKNKSNEKLSNSLSSPSVTAEALNMQNRRIVVFILDFSDKTTSNTVSIKDLYALFYTAPDSMKANYARSSFNQLILNPDPNNDGAPDFYTIKLNYPIGTTCDFRKWTSDAKNAAQAMGVNLSLYQHKMIVFPSNASCAWNGLGELGCGSNDCNTWIRAISPISSYVKGTYAHEIGHNLGMDHADLDSNNDGVSDANYGDQSCFMGGNQREVKEVNAPHRDQMKWFDAYPGSLKIINQNGTFALSPLEAGANNNLLALKIPKPNTSEYYYISYRTNLGPFGAGALNFTNKVNIYTIPSAGPNANHTYFLSALDVNGTFLDEKNKLSFKVLSMDGSKANVQVTFIGTQDPTKISAIKFFSNDNTYQAGYADWDPNYWKGNCPPYSEPVGLSTNTSTGRANAIACLMKDSNTSTAKGEFVYDLGGVAADHRAYHRLGDWDSGFYKWECGLDQYVSSMSQSTTTIQLHKIRCAKGTFTNGGQNACEVRFVGNGKDDRGSLFGGDWDPNFYKGQCSDGKLIFGVSVDVKTYKPHKILCCDK